MWICVKRRCGDVAPRSHAHDIYVHTHTCAHIHTHTFIRTHAHSRVQAEHALVGEAQAKRQMQSIIERRRADEKASIERNKAKEKDAGLPDPVHFTS